MSSPYKAQDATEDLRLCGVGQSLGCHLRGVRGEGFHYRKHMWRDLKLILYTYTLENCYEFVKKRHIFYSILASKKIKY